ncbi:Gfo/Idh/MocA family protein [Phenylobacterium sp.]|uniref:Gfo/Idh/MocA family protein n=1 Tax=Phenylobacterium sp. TaxID=1871053 RepID=UPI00271F4905|nr:Gfo/Idh/MocA family oxidoreductase [Phenylobacterium sp.]MDO8802236.1 Gfo/Idh/MocA family oxidoreductase [Phenylobacterium sp.]
MTSQQAPMRIGILGAAKIAPAAMILPAKATGVATVVAVAARDPARARAFADLHGVPEISETYEALIARPDIDAVYNALTPSRHADLSIAALQAGKHVLCEKPFAMNADEARAMVAAADTSGKVLMEAFHYRYHPLFARLLEIIGSGELGEVRELSAVFQTRLVDDGSEIRYERELGGGSLLDIGAYPLHWVRTAAWAEPTVVRAGAVFGRGGVDHSTEAELLFPNGAVARISGSMVEDTPIALLEVTGTLGALKAINPLAPQMGHLLEVKIAGAEPRRETFSRDPTYDFQLRAFVEACRGGPAPLTSGKDSIAQMVLLDAVSAASRL